MTVFEIQSNSRKRDVKFVSLIRLVAPPTIFANNFHLQTYVPSTQELGKKKKKGSFELVVYNPLAPESVFILG